MESIIQFIQQLLAAADWANLTVGAVIGIAVVAAYAVWAPNKWMYNQGVKVGRKLSTLGRKAIKKEGWEHLEDNLIGSAAAFISGVQDGANEDDAI